MGFAVEFALTRLADPRLAGLVAESRAFTQVGLA